jgi:hypothetical protein
MLVVIRTGKDRKEYKKLKDRVAELEIEVRDLRSAHDNHEHGEYVTWDYQHRSDEDELDDLDERLGNLDFFKADRNHTHEVDK